MENKIYKLIQELKENKWIHYIIIIVMGIALSIPLTKIQIRDTHDGAFHFLRILGTEDALKIGEIPPIINQNYCKGARICNQFILSSNCNIYTIIY